MNRAAESLVSIHPRLCLLTQYFDRIFLLLILMNTIALAMEYHGMPSGYATALCKLACSLAAALAHLAHGPFCVVPCCAASINFVLTVSFTVEMVLKVVGSGIKEYCRKGFNVFDGIIVGISLFELASNSGSTFSALRAVRSASLLSACHLTDFVAGWLAGWLASACRLTADSGWAACRLVRIFRMFRVLRVLKLFRHLESLQRTVLIVTKSLGEISFITALLGLFCFM